MRRLSLALAVGAFTLLIGCSESSPETSCTPGASIACVGAGGCSGGQVCNAEGTGYDACDCGTGSPDAGAGEDAGSDAGSEPCNVVEQTGCAEGERCTWFRASGAEGGRECAPDGTQALNAPCTVDGSGFDDCARGGVCVGGMCRAPCAPSVPSSCNEDFTCVQYAGFDEGGESLDLGFCDPTCDPMTQVREHDGAPACGSPDPANPTLGCYGTGPFTCAPILNDARNLRHGDEAAGSSSGTAWLNGCAPGYLPLLRASSESSQVICIALCAPGETWKDQPANANGVSPYTCADRGATGGTVECRYWHLLEQTIEPATEWSNTLGLCFDYASYTWDHDQDPGTANVATPSCTSLSNADDDGDGWGEHTAWACGPRPEL